MEVLYDYFLSLGAVADAPAVVQTIESLSCENGGIVGMGDERDCHNSPVGSAESSKVEVDLAAVNTTLPNENASNNISELVHLDSASEKYTSLETFQESSKDDSQVLVNSSFDGDVAPSSIQNDLLEGSSNSIELVKVPVTLAIHEEPEPSYSYITVSKNDVTSSEMVGCENESTLHTIADPETPFADVNKLVQNNFTTAAFEEGLATNVFNDFEGETNVNTTIRSQYGHIYSTQHLEDIIESARSEKVPSSLNLFPFVVILLNLY